jgi:hypothetical protein
MINPCLVLCTECIHCKEVSKRLICTIGNFDVKYNDGILFVPLDFDCFSFSKTKDDV